MTLSLGTLKFDAPVFLAPMSGVTDAPYRALARRFGPCIMVSEMFASSLLRQASAPRSRPAPSFAAEAPLIVQLVGGEPAAMAEAARIAADAGAAAIDINMGCPARKIGKTGGGAVLMRDPDGAAAIVAAVCRAVDLPVSVKMRLGWDDASRNAAVLAARVVGEGARMITVHGRTREQLYGGVADWAAIREVVSAVPVPVIANGDVCDVATARRAMAESGASGVMIGRAACGAPWLAGHIAAGLADGRMPPPPSLAEQRDLLLEQLETMMDYYGGLAGLRAARKHIAWATRGLAGAAVFRDRVFAADTAPETRALIAAFFEETVRVSRSLAA